MHLVYFTAYPDAKGRMSYRRDVYGRDAALFDALSVPGWNWPAFRAKPAATVDCRRGGSMAHTHPGYCAAPWAPRPRAILT